MNLNINKKITVKEKVYNNARNISLFFEAIIAKKKNRKSIALLLTIYKPSFNHVLDIILY